MAYTIQAIVTNKTRSNTRYASSLSWIDLPQSMVIALFDQPVRDQNSIPFLPLIEEGLDNVPVQISSLCEKISSGGKLAYIEAEIFGGVGTQASALWTNGIMVGKIVVADDAINQALRALGVDKNSNRDEFEALELGRHRNLDDWNKIRN